MFDVFYLGQAPGLFPHERSARDIEDARQQSCTRFFWIVNYLCDYSGFDFLWEPCPWESHQRHVWSSVWQKDSGTYLIPKSGYQDTNYHDVGLPTNADMRLWENIDSIQGFDFTWHPDYTDPPFNYEFGTQWQKTGGPRYPVKGATETKYVSQSGSTARAIAQHVYVIDHMDGNAGAVVQQIPVTVVKIVRFFDNYKDTLTRLANSIPKDQEFVWIVSSICDYSNFDFSWHPEAWQNHMLHVFASNDEKFGDTFFMHVPTFRAKIAEFELLDWYDLNFVSTMRVSRRPMPVILHDHDSQVNPVKTQTWSGPLALFTTHDYVTDAPVTVPLWREKTRTIVPLSDGAGSVIVPKSAVPYIKTQLYDYPYIDRDHRILTDDPLDIVFISNGEYGADDHYECIVWSMRQHDYKTENRIHRVDGVNGRVAAYQAAARMSQTDWFFAVFAKLQVNEDFDWRWQPDRMQEAKHYIFHAYNPVNNLVYGHQAMIAYNRRLVLENTGQGLDFTLDQSHEVVPIVSGTAYYDNDPWTCWRTAFREVLKLRHSLPDVENEYRMNEWLTKGEGVNGHWSVIGAEDAIDYYDQVGGDFDELKKSYEWQWLASYAMVLHPTLFTHSKT
jgi:hypothetical protein